jgi:hypothetical protein
LKPNCKKIRPSEQQQLLAQAVAAPIAVGDDQLGDEAVSLPVVYPFQNSAHWDKLAAYLEDASLQN